MPFPATVVRILISSPGDVQEERLAIVRVIDEWNSINCVGSKVVLIPVFWERDARPELGQRPQAIINNQLVKSCDILVAIFWTRLGTPTGVASSGTVEEIDEFRRSNKEVLVYFSTKHVDVNSVNIEQYTKLKEYKRNLSAQGLYKEYKSIHELERLVLNHLSKTIQQKFGSFLAYEEQNLDYLEKVREEIASDDSFEEDYQRLAGLSLIKHRFHKQLLSLEEILRESKEKNIYPLNDTLNEIEKIRSEVFLLYKEQISIFTRYSRDEIRQQLFDDFIDLSGHKIYMDGGVSYREFWEKGEKLLESFGAFIESM